MNAKPQSPATVRRVDVGELALNVTTYPGDGPTVFLLHGVGSREMTWWPVIDRLTPHFELVIPDWRGHGASDKPASGYGVDDYARDLKGLFAACDAGRPKIVGHSLGGMVALRWASRQPARAERIVLEDAPLRNVNGTAGQELFAGWIALASGTIEEAAATYAASNPSWTREECLRRAESITLTALPVFAEMRDRNLGIAADRVAESAGIASPVLLVHGDVEAGGMVFQEDADRFAVTLPNATAVRIPGGPHSLHRDRPDEFLAAIIPFLLGGAAPRD
jgi:pimeloyl-ACP methyl ester carboxylesterase